MKMKKNKTKKIGSRVTCNKTLADKNGADRRTYVKNIVPPKIIKIIEPENSLQAPPSGNALENFHFFTLDNYIKKESSLANVKDVEGVFKQSDILYKCLLMPNKAININLNGISLYDQIVGLLNNNRNSVALCVQSHAGYGKTEFLSLLYQYLYQKYQEGVFHKIPLYINLHYYNKRIYKLDEHKIYTTQAYRIFLDDAKSLMSFLESSTQDIVLILDGNDDFQYSKIDIDDLQTHLHRNLSVINCQIIGLRNYSNMNNRKYCKENRLFANADIIIEFNSIDLKKEEIAQQVIDSFACLEELYGHTKDHKKLSQFIKEKAKSLGLDRIDMFHLFLLSKCLQNMYLRAGSDTLTMLYESYLTECKIDIAKASRLAFDLFYYPNNLTQQDKDTREWWKLLKHDNLRDYLIANHLIQKMIEFKGTEDVDIFNFIYPCRLNTFCKEIINSTNESKKKIFDSIKNIFPKAELSAKIHLCYLLGRIENVGKTKKDIISFLMTQKYSEHSRTVAMTPVSLSKKLNEDEKMQLLYYRTICISLICLGEKNVSEEYIQELLSNRYFDNLNRGFHLEYYEDVEFSQQINNEDKLGPFDRTYEQLGNKLKSAISANRFYPLLQVDLYTLCSLAQHRLVKKESLDSEKRQGVVKIIEGCKRFLPKMCRTLINYLDFIEPLLKNEKRIINETYFMEKLYSLKCIPRKGWVIRDVVEPESIASHMYGALLLAYLFLPEKIEEAGYETYDKNTVMRMLIVHDLGEAYTGDYTPQEKTEKVKQEEKKAVLNLAKIWTYNLINGGSNLFELFESFTEDCYDVNAKIARDFDKLDNLLQLYIYKSKYSIKDFQLFRENLFTEIKTRIGISIKENIVEYFDGYS